MDDEDLLLEFPEIPPYQAGEQGPVLSAAQWRQIQEVAAELSNRKCESLRLYEPTAYQQQYHACRAMQCLLQGGNRSGKSLCGFVEDARAVTGQDPFQKYPLENGVLAIIGADLDHIGTVVYRYLFMPGAFFIIRDLHTNLWRTYRPWDAGDKKRKSERRPAPPLIPPRFGNPEKDIAWHIKKKRQFTLAVLSTGWEIKAISSRSDPPQGYQANLAHIDEDLENEEHFYEIQPRLLERGGLLRVTAMPHAENEFLTQINEAADREDEEGIAVDSPQRLVVRIQASMLDNPHIEQEYKDKQVKLFLQQGVDVYNQRVKGLLDSESSLVYPTFDKRTHVLGFDPHHAPPIPHPVYKLKEIPRSWCRYTWTDPGHTVCSTLFFAIPPPEYGDFVIVYDELYITQSTAETWGKRMKDKCRDQTIQAFGIDDHGSRPTDAGSGQSIRRQYSSALERHECYSVLTGTNFLLGMDDVQARVSLVRSALSLRDNLPPRLLFVDGAAPNCVNEFKRYRKKVIRTAGGTKIITDAPVARNNHAMNCLEYAIGHGCVYVPPPSKGPAPKSLAQQVIEMLHDRFRRQEEDPHQRGEDTISLGPRGYRSS